MNEPKFKRQAKIEDCGINIPKRKGFSLDLYDEKGNVVGKYKDSSDRALTNQGDYDFIQA